MTASVAQDVAMLAIELEQLRQKSIDDDLLITVLKEHNKAQADDMESMRKKYMEEMGKMRQERDEALQRSTEVVGMIRSIGNLALAGVERMLPKPPPPATEAEVLDELRAFTKPAGAPVRAGQEPQGPRLPYAPPPRQVHRDYEDDERLPALEFLRPVKVPKGGAA